jgi:CHAT domain-containing protein/tetratricopeptide (TPR) repeat protein
MKREGLLLSDGSGFSADYLEKIGQSLYKSLFPVGEVSDLLQRSIALAEKDHNPQLHIQIEFSAGVTELNRLPDYPWEMVHDGQRFLAHHNVTFSRYIAHLSAPPTLSSVSPINVLLVSSGAYDEENKFYPLSKNEYEAVKKGLKKSQEDKHIHFSEPKQASFKELTTYLTENRGDDAPHVLHFDGHGAFGKRCLNSECRTFNTSKLEKCEKCGTALSASQGYLLFEPDENDDEREANYVNAKEIGSLLQSIRHGDSHAQQGGVRLAVLSACRSAYALGGSSVFNGVAQSLIGHGVPAVVAMQYKVSPKGATAFAERFYRELGNKQSLAVATSQGRVAMQNVEHNQWYRLIFYLRWQANDGGQLFASVGDNSAKSQTTKTISIPDNVPPSSVNFVGRETELKDIHAKLQAGQGVSVCAVEGMGGLGKSELALQYAWRYRGEYAARYWLSLRGVDLAQAVVTLAKRTLPLPKTMLSATLDEQAAWYWQNWLPQEGNVLVIFDDVNDLQSIPKQVRPLTERFQILVTTRKRKLSSQFADIPLRVISEDEALELLRKLLGKSRVDREKIAAQAICEYLGCLPLGVELAGRYLQLDEDLRLIDYQQRLTIADESLDLQETEEINATRGVIAAFELSWQELSAGTGRVAMLLGLFAPADIAWALVEEVAANLIDGADLREGRKQLNNLYLMKSITEDRTRFAIHSLTRQFLQWKLAQDSDTNRLFRETFVMNLLGIAKQIPQSPTRDLIAKVTLTIPHLDMLSREMLDDIPNPEEDLGWAFTGIARFYVGQGLYALAEVPYQRRLISVRKILGSRHPSVATSLNNLAELYRSQAKYEEAEPLYLEALRLRRELLGDRHLDVTFSLNNLALLYQSQGKYEEAEPLYLEALRLRRELLGDRHPDVAQSLNNLASLHKLQGRYGEAEPLYQEALSILKLTVGENHPSTHSVMSALKMLAQ